MIFFTMLPSHRPWKQQNTGAWFFAE